MYGPAVRNEIVAGAKLLRDVVASTLGPAGRNVTIYENGARPLITKDGATVASKVDTDDTVKKIGILLVKDVVAKVDNVAGDGTTTTTIYTTELLDSLTKLVNLEVNAHEVRKGMERATKDAVEYLENKKEQLDDVEAIALVSVNGDKELAGLLTEAYNGIGENGSVVLADSWSRSGKSYVEISKGIRWEGGIPSSLFITDVVNDSAKVENPYIMVLASGVKELDNIITYNELIKREGRNLVVVAPYFESTLFSKAAAEGILFLMSPGTSFSHVDLHEALMDLAITVGTKVVPDTDSILRFVPSLNDLGTAKCIEATVKETNIAQADELDEVKAVEYVKYIEQLKAKIDGDDALQITAMEGLRERLARLSGGIATIYLGALTPTEKEEKAALLEDAQNSVSIALKNGVLPGGGTALLKAAQYLADQDITFETEAERKGYEAVLKAMREPAKQLVKSVKPEDYQYIVQQIAHESDFWTGYNVREAKIENLKESKVIDSAMIEISALRYAASEVGSFIISDGVIVNANKHISYDVNDRRIVEAF